MKSRNEVTKFIFEKTYIKISLFHENTERYKYKRVYQFKIPLW